MKKKYAGNGTKEWFLDAYPVKVGQCAKYKGTFVDSYMEGIGKLSKATENLK